MALFAPLSFSGEITKPDNIVTYEAMCYDTTLLFNGLKNTHKEYPILVGKADDVANSTMSLWIHSEEKNWTIVATKDELSCIIGSGTDFKLIPYKKNPRL